MLRSLAFTFCILLPIINCLAGGIRGVITTNNVPLPFATVYVKEVASGGVSNAKGQYQITLAPGTYTVVFKFLGYQSKTETVIVGQGFTEFNVDMLEQAVMLNEVVVQAGKEDPAYTVMRKAIAKAKYHTQQVDAYTATVYLKGKGRLKKAPFYARRRLKKEGIDTSKLFIEEIITNVSYKRPNQYSENILSVRTFGDGEDGQVSPMQYVNGSFYDPKVGGSVSPLSPKAFSYYRFIYKGTFSENGYEISKIQVIPRSRGDDLFAGYLQIVEEYWSIYSLALSTTKLGIRIDLESIAEPIQGKVWMPISHKFTIDGKIMGFAFEYKYLASVSDYDITIYPDLPVEFDVIDEKVEKELTEILDKNILDKSPKKSKTLKDIQEKLADGQEISSKELRKLLKDYEKIDRLELADPNLLFSSNREVDSLAFKKDSAYWAQARPIPLDAKEIESYQHMDSLAAVQKMEREGDTLSTKDRDHFKLTHLIVGGRYKIGDKTYLRLSNPRFEFNTVEGFNLEYALAYSKTIKKKNWIKIEPVMHYAFSSKQFYPKLNFAYNHGKRINRSELRLSGGKYIKQFNSARPIHPTINTIASLLFEQNFMKIYEHTFAEIKFKKSHNRKVVWNLGLQYSNRSPLTNTSSYNFLSSKDREYTENLPVNNSIPLMSFALHDAVIATAEIRYSPWLKYSMRNKRKYPIKNSSPTFEVSYRSGIEGLGDADFHHLEIGGEYQFELGVRGKLKTRISAGSFLESGRVEFMDFKHFMGNLTPFTTADPVASYRLLDYYKYSTDEQYVSAFVHYQFRKFLFTRIPRLRLFGLKENVFVNYLGTPNSNHYTEVGFTIDNIMHIFRVELISSFQNGEYQNFGVRVGLATFFTFRDGQLRANF